MPIDNVIGDCPTFEPPSDMPAFTECVGFRDDPPSSEGDRMFGDTSGFNLRGIVQFFHIHTPSLSELPLSRLRRHSCVDMRWKSTGTIEHIRLDNYKNDLVFTPLWSVTDSWKQPHEEDTLSSSCPILPPHNTGDPVRTSQTRTAGSVVNDTSYGGTLWSNLDKTTISDDIRAVASVSVSTDNISYYLKMLSFGFDIPDDATDITVMVRVERSGSEADRVKDSRFRVVTESGIQATEYANPANWPGPTDTTVEYDLTGENLTVGQLNNSAFGVAIAIQRISGSAPQGRIDKVEIVVTYTSEQSLATHETAGALLRVMAFEGSYGVETPSGKVSEGSSSSVCDRFPGLTCSAKRIVYYDMGLFEECAGSTISQIDPTLCDTYSEMILEFDSTGHLKRVYWGGEFACDRNPCVWDRDDPPDGTAGVVVPLIQFVDDDDNNNFRVWQVHFDSTGRYHHACEYALLCGCRVEPPSGSLTLGCLCMPVACVRTGLCNPVYATWDCPATFAFDCEDALEGGGDHGCGDVAGYCVYTWNGDGQAPCCTAAASPLSSDIEDEEHPHEGIAATKNSNTKACRYFRGSSGCNS